MTLDENMWTSFFIIIITLFLVLLIGSICIFIVDFKAYKASKLESKINHGHPNYTGTILFVCDRKACYQCNNPDCHHTTIIEHAANFKKNNHGDYVEKE